MASAQDERWLQESMQYCFQRSKAAQQERLFVHTGNTDHAALWFRQYALRELTLHRAEWLTVDPLTECVMPPPLVDTTSTHADEALAKALMWRMKSVFLTRDCLIIDARNAQLKDANSLFFDLYVGSGIRQMAVHIITDKPHEKMFETLPIQCMEWI